MDERQIVAVRKKEERKRKGGWIYIGKQSSSRNLGINCLTQKCRPRAYERVSLRPREKYLEGGHFQRKRRGSRNGSMVKEAWKRWSWVVDMWL